MYWKTNRTRPGTQQQHSLILFHIFKFKLLNTIKPPRVSLRAPNVYKPHGLYFERVVVGRVNFYLAPPRNFEDTNKPQFTRFLLLSA